MDPQSYQEAMDHPDVDKWRTAIHKEYGQIHEKQTWDLCKRSDIPSNLRPLSGKLVFKTKRDKNGQVLKHKVRWVVRGFEQREGIDFDQVFAGTCTSTTWKLAIALAAKYSYEVHQMDVIAAFLQGDIDSDIYVDMPPKWKEILELQKEVGDVCKLSKALYGLRQSPRLWQKKLQNVLNKLGYQTLPSDQAAFINPKITESLIIVTHVDDFLIVAKSSSLVDKFKKDISKYLEIEDLGHAQYFLGVRIQRSNNGAIYLCQDAYIKKI